MSNKSRIIVGPFASRALTWALLCILLIGCNKKDEPGQLSPARNIVGNWTSPSAVVFYMAIDGCGNYARYNSTPSK
jgi:hypothetical protein